jgi:RNA-directed DNA polymerase
MVENTSANPLASPMLTTSDQTCLWKNVNGYLSRWMMRKYKRLAKRPTMAFREVARLASGSPSAFVHWEAGVIP